MILWLLLWSHFPPSQSPTLYIYFSLYFFLYLHLSSPFLSSYLRLSSSVFYFLCRPHTISRGQVGQRRFSLPESPLFSKALFADDWELWSRARNTFQGCQHQCLDWPVLLKHAKTHNFICLLNKKRMSVKAKLLGGGGFSQTRLKTRHCCLQSFNKQWSDVTLKEWQGM